MRCVQPVVRPRVLPTGSVLRCSSVTLRPLEATCGTTPVTPPRGWFLKSMPHSRANTSMSVAPDGPAWVISSATSKPMPPAPMMATRWPTGLRPRITSM
jgi:hypothetical protein